MASEDYPSGRSQTESAAAEVDRLTAMGEITGCPGRCHPPDPRTCPPQLIAKPDEVQAAHDWSNPEYGLNKIIVNPSAECGDMDGSLSMLPLGASVAGLGCQDCFIRYINSNNREGGRDVQRP